jgi:ribonuclease J
MEPVRIIPLGGLGEFGMNMMILEYGESAIAIDCGVMFPGADLLGIDLVIPDISYLLEQKKKLKAVVLTHAHEDHMGALPYVLKQLAVPIFGTRLTLGLLRHRLREHHLDETADLTEIKAGNVMELAPFKFEGIRVTHSLVDCLAVAIHTPVGAIIHTGDFKIDHTPMEGELFDFRSFAAYGEQGVLLLLSDSTNVEREGYTRSEREVGKNLEMIFQKSSGKIFVATFASSIPRIQQVIDLSERHGRKTVFSGRSMINNTQIASDLGYLRLPKQVLTEGARWQALPPEQITFVTTGSQGEPLSALHRVALDDHKSIKIEPGDTVVVN